MKKDTIIRTVGIMTIFCSVLFFIFLDVSKLESIGLGVIMGIALGISSNGKETKLLGKYLFK